MVAKWTIQGELSANGEGIKVKWIQCRANIDVLAEE
jgi:hypothetical protein